MKIQCIIITLTSVGRGQYKMVVGICPSVCRVPRHNCRMERLWKPKIDRMEAHHHTGNHEIVMTIPVASTAQSIDGTREPI